MNATTTYEQATHRRPADIYPKAGGSRGIYDAILEWLGRVGERSSLGRQAAAYQRLNALEDAQLARMDMKRSDLLERCFGWRAYY